MIPERLQRAAARLRVPSDWWTEGRPWMGYVLLAAAILVLLGVLCLVAAGLIVLSIVGGREGSDFSKGIPMALLWLFGVFFALGIAAFYFWWALFRGDRPRRGHSDLEAAQSGDGTAAHRLGLHYRDRDPASARAWLSQAAHAGVAEAMVELAQDLRLGRGGPRDLASARAWLLRAAAASAPRAQALLEEVEAQLGDRHSERGI